MRHIARLAALACSLAVFEVSADTSTASVTAGESHRRSGHQEQALESLRQAAIQQPRSIQAQLKLAGFLLNQQQYRPSVGAFQRAIGIDPTNAKAFAGLGLAYLHMGRYGPAHAALSQAVLLDPEKSADVAPLLARIEERIGPLQSPAFGQ